MKNRKNKFRSGNPQAATGADGQHFTNRRKRVVNARLLAVSIVVGTALLLGIYLLHKVQSRAAADAFLRLASTSLGAKEWSKAASYFERYLVVNPDNAAVHAQLVDVYSKMASTPAQLQRLNAMLHQSIGMLPEREDLRLKLAENQLQLRDYSKAEQTATQLLQVEGKTGLAAKRIVALSQFGIARTGQSQQHSLPTAIASLLEAADAMPGDVPLVSVAADALRLHSSAAQLNGAIPQDRADALMARLVEENPHEDALLARYYYRKRFGLSGAKEDLDRALEVSPDSVDVLILAAAESQSQANLAEQLLRKAIEIAPHSVRGHVALADVLRRQNKLSEAIEVLGRVKHSTLADKLELELNLTELLLAAQRFQEAQESQEVLENTATRLLPNLATTQKTTIENRIRLIEAQIAVHQRDFDLAVSLLRAIYLSGGSEVITAASSESLKALVMLAELNQTLQRWDVAAQYWDDLIKIVAAKPNHEKDVARLQLFAGTAYLHMGRPVQAIQRLERSREISADPVAATTLVQAHLVMQLRQPKPKRNWVEFERLLTDAKRRKDQDWHLILIEAEYLSSLDSTDARQTLLQLLQEANSEHAEDPEWLRSLAIAYSKLGEHEAADQALARYAALDASPMRIASLKSLALLARGELEASDKAISDALTTLKPEEQMELQLEHAKLLMQNGHVERAYEVTNELHQRRPRNQAVAMLAFELSLVNEDLVSAKRLEDSIAQSLEGKSFEFRFLRAKRMLANYPSLEHDEQAQLSHLIELLRTERPQWHPVILLSAHYARQAGELDRALKELELAAALGDDSPETIHNVVTLLFARGRFDDASEYLARLSDEHAGSPQLDSLAISLAIRQERVDEALQLARESIERHPDDGMWRVWYANLLLAKGQMSEAQSELESALGKFPNDIRVWNGLFRFYMQTDQLDSARTALDALDRNSAIDQVHRHLAMGEAYELLNEPDLAVQSYRGAIQLSPENTVARLKLAQLLAANDRPRARAAFEEILRIEPDNADARRQLAYLLAASGEEADWNEALELLKNRPGSSSPGAEAEADSRIRAIMLTRRGRNRQQRLANLDIARSILERQIQSSTVEDVDYILLASLHEQESLLRDDPTLLLAGREQLRPLVDRPDVKASNLRLYIDYLLRSAISLQQASEKHQQLVEVVLGDAASRLAELKRVLEIAELGEVPAEVVNLEARLLHQQGKGADAQSFLEQWAEKTAAQAIDENTRIQIWLKTGVSLTQIGCHEAAVKWFERLTNASPKGYELLVRALVAQGRSDDAIKVCMDMTDGTPAPDVAATLAQLATTSRPELALSEVQSFINTAVEQHNQNTRLLMAVAVMKASQGASEDAISLFRKIVEVEPQNALALNNLATLLAEDPDQLGEALRYIDKAIGFAGRQPSLLDTKGTIQLLQNQPLLAIESLEEAVAGVTADPRYFLHLAAAYQSAGRGNQAEDALKIAIEMGVEKALLTSGDKEMLRKTQRESMLTSKAS